MSKLVTVISFGYEAEALVAKSLLEANDIECYLKNETISSIYPLPQFGGVDLQVLDENEEKALDVLVEGGFLESEEL